MSSVTISIAIKLNKKELNGQQAKDLAQAYGNQISKFIYRQAERLYSYLDQKVLILKSLRLSKEDINDLKKPKIWTHDLLCECSHKCNGSNRTYWKFLRGELVWENGHLR